MQTETHIASAWSEAVAGGDVAALLELYHPHVVVETPMGRWHGVDEVADGLGALPWRKLRQHRILACHVQSDRIALITQHGDRLVEHVLQVVGGQVRAHRMRLAPAF